MISGGAGDGDGHGAIQASCQKVVRSPSSRDGDLQAAERLDSVGVSANTINSAGADGGIGHGVIQSSCGQVTSLMETSLILRDGDLQAAGRLDIVGASTNTINSTGADDSIGLGVIQPSSRLMAFPTFPHLICRDGGKEVAERLDIVRDHICTCDYWQ